MSRENLFGRSNPDNEYLIDLAGRVFDQESEGIRFSLNQDGISGIEDLIKKGVCPPGYSKNDIGLPTEQWLLFSMLKYLQLTDQKPQHVWPELLDYMVERGMMEDYKPVRRAVRRKLNETFGALVDMVGEVSEEVKKSK